ncbi:MAG: pyridoxamine 5'-phosphate oxidase family protein [Candidatus Zhuqueibacterota bacterium]
MPVKWLPREKCLRLLKKAVYGRLATCGSNSEPYITPMNFVLFNDCIYFHCAFEGNKLENLHHNPRVCFEISAAGKLYAAPLAKNFTMRYWSVLVFGEAKQIDDPTLKLAVLNALMDKYARGYQYSPLQFEDTAIVNIVEIAIHKISGKVSVDPPK